MDALLDFIVPVFVVAAAFLVAVFIFGKVFESILMRMLGYKYKIVRNGRVIGHVKTEQEAQRLTGTNHSADE